MSQTEPTLELIPRRPAACADAAVSLDVLVRVVPPARMLNQPRPPLNLALVLDRSGSMTGNKKLPYAIAAARFAVEQLLPTDRVSVVSFDDQVETIVPSTPAEDIAGIVRRIEGLYPRGSTNVHGGWAEGGRQAESRRQADALNRVILLTDGLANVGVTDPAAITADVAAQASRGVSTTAMGLGEDYNEDLIEAMAEAGDGHYYYIETPAMLPDLFQSELRGLMASSGVRVSLGLEAGEGVAVADVLNDFERLPTGRQKLPNLVSGLDVPVVVRLSLPPRPAASPGLVLGVRLAWDPPGGGGRRSIHARLDLPSLPQSAWLDLPEHPEVRDQEALLMAARAQKEAAAALERGDLAGTRAYVARSMDLLEMASESAEMAQAQAEIEEVRAMLDAGEHGVMRKLAKSFSYKRRKGRTDT